MESTGSYWKPVFNILEGHFKVILANLEQVKALRGKKTDRKDCRWLAGLLRHGLVQASFIPPRDIRELRDLTRRRRSLLQNGTQERNRVQKVLEDANVKIGNVLSDVFGMSGQAMLEALLENQLSPEQMADLARGTLRRKIPQIVEALEGHRMSDHHRLLIRQSLKHMQFIEEMIEELDKQIREKLAPYPKPVELVCTGTWDWKRCRSQYSGGNRNGDERQRSLLPVVTIWLPGAGVCPGNNSSAGKRKSGRIRKGNRWVESHADANRMGWGPTRRIPHFSSDISA